jgi:hypothetical protein
LSLSNATLSLNTAGAGYGGAIFNGGAMTVLNSIVAGNTGSAGSDIYESGGTVALANYDLIGNTTNSGISTGSGTTNLNPTTVGLATTLAGNGGPTKTLALLAGSPAIGSGGALTTVAAADTIGVSDTTITVTNAANLGIIAGDTYILIGQEEMLVTGVNLTTNTLTVVRGVEETTANTHASGSAVYLGDDQRGFLRLTPPDIGAYQTFGIQSATATPDGIVLLFSEPINPAKTVLYTSPGDTTLGAADITVVGATSGAVRGSLVIDPTNPNGQRLLRRMDCSLRTPGQ